jgi:hypothetical protein
MKWITRENAGGSGGLPLADRFVIPRRNSCSCRPSEWRSPRRGSRRERGRAGHHGKECSFDAIVKKHGLTSNPALVLLAGIVNSTDTDNTLWNQPESAGLRAVAKGSRPRFRTTTS